MSTRWMSTRWMSAHTGIALVALVWTAIGASGCGTSMNQELPDLATQSPSKQPMMSPADQRKAIDDLIAKRDKQAAEAAAAEKSAKFR